MKKDTIPRTAARGMNLVSGALDAVYGIPSSTTTTLREADAAEPESL